VQDIEIREAVFNVITTYARPYGHVKEEFALQQYLINLGIDSVGTISILLELEDKIGVKFDSAFGSTPPETVEDVLNMVMAQVK
jgi:acyl carrier protein